MDLRKKRGYQMRTYVTLAALCCLIGFGPAWVRTGYSLTADGGKKELDLDGKERENPTDLLYYYTVPSNLSYHLLPLCFRCLCSFFGGYNDLPPLITAAVNQIDDMEFVVDGRKDIILNHMPAFSIVHMVELNVLSVIPGRIDSALFDKLKKREHARKKAKQQMKREDQRIRVDFLHPVDS